MLSVHLFSRQQELLHLHLHCEIFCRNCHRKLRSAVWLLARHTGHSARTVVAFVTSVGHIRWQCRAQLLSSPYRIKCSLSACITAVRQQFQHSELNAVLHHGAMVSFRIHTHTRAHCGCNQLTADVYIDQPSPACAQRIPRDPRSGPM